MLKYNPKMVKRILIFFLVINIDSTLSYKHISLQTTVITVTSIGTIVYYHHLYFAPKKKHLLLGKQSRFSINTCQIIIAILFSQYNLVKENSGALSLFQPCPSETHLVRQTSELIKASLAYLSLVKHSSYGFQVGKPCFLYRRLYDYKIVYSVYQGQLAIYELS